MLDFYGRKKRCIEMGKLLTNQDKQWYRDQRHRLAQRRRGERRGGVRGSTLTPTARSTRTPSKAQKLLPGTTRAIKDKQEKFFKKQKNLKDEGRQMRKEVEFR